MATMQADTDVHHFVDDYYIVESYMTVYGSPIYPMPDHDKPIDNTGISIFGHLFQRKGQAVRDVGGLSRKSFVCMNCTVVIATKSAIIG